MILLVQYSSLFDRIKEILETNWNIKKFSVISLVSHAHFSFEWGFPIRWILFLDIQFFTTPDAKSSSFVPFQIILEIQQPEQSRFNICFLGPKVQKFRISTH